MGTLKTDNITSRTGNAINIGVSGDTVTIPTGASLVVTDGIAVSSLPTVTVAKGGTGLTSAGSANQTLKMNSGGSALEFGTLPVAGGGTGAATHTANNVLIGAGTSAVTSVAPSTSGNVLTSTGTVWASTAPAGGGAGLVFVSTATASDDATLSFTGISSTYAQYVFIISALRPATSGAELRLRVSTNGGSSYDTGSTDYCSGVRYLIGGTLSMGVNDNDTFLRVGPPTGNASNDSVNGRMELHSASDSAKFTQISSLGSFSRTNGDPKAYYSGGGRKSVAAHNAVQFSMSSGNITSGSIRMYGIANS
tara:strand:- start:196 stop:1119 length:924 start_codon:yes stop_codon:yes gene_type:complete